MKSRHECKEFNKECKKCRTKHWINNLDPDMVRKYFKQSIPELYLDAKLSDFREKLTDSFKDPDKGVYICSVPGVGKTRLMACMAMIWMRMGESVIRINYNDMIAKVKATISDNTISEAEVMDEFFFCDRLIIEDVGVQTVGSKPESDYNQNIIMRIINNRYENIMPVYITSNVTLNELADIHGVRMASRISAGRVLEMKGETRR